MPDIDVDFEYAERSRVIEYVTEKIWKGFCDTDYDLWYDGSPRCHQGS